MFPRLAGQNAEYIAKQLANFKNGTRKSTAMASMVTSLSPEDMAALGQFYASRPPHKEAAKDAPLALVGQYIYQAGNKFSGVPAWRASTRPIWTTSSSSSASASATTTTP